jgi:hypothetical protein
MSFEVIPPYDEQEVRAAAWKVGGFLLAVLGICFALNYWSDRGADQAARDFQAQKEAHHDVRS